MSGKYLPADQEISDAMNGALDDLERIQALMKKVIVTLDDMRGRVRVRHEDWAPGPWDDEHPENRRGGQG